MVTNTPGDCALLRRRRTLVSLTFDTKIHDVVSTDRAVIHNDIPRPQHDGMPLLHLEPLLPLCISIRRTTLGGFGDRLRFPKSAWCRVPHFNIRHVLIEFGPPYLSVVEEWLEPLSSIAAFSNGLE